MAHTEKLFRKLVLENLMLHDNTTIDLAKEAITLITGANGSGKTQILDGLIICLGYIPQRAKGKGIGSLVGERDEFARVSLTLNNPIIDGRFAIQTLDQDLNNVISQKEFTITAKISKQENSVTYYLNNSRRIVRGRLVTRRDIRRIFESIGVRGDNKLAFTGEGTVDEFAAKSPKRKLDVLLDVTGLKHYREEIIAAQETLKASIQEIEPLKRKYETEKKLLNLWNNTLSLLAQKKKLVYIKKKLETELSWSLVQRVEKQIEALNKERLKILKKKEEVTEKIEQKIEEIDSKTEQLTRLNDKLAFVKEKEAKKNHKLIILKTQIASDTENIQNLENELARFEEQKADLEKILRTKELSAKDRQLKEKYEILAVKEAKLAMIQEKYTRAEKELQELQKQLVPVSVIDDYDLNGEIFTGDRLTKYEESLVNAAKRFTVSLRSQGLENDVLGPLITYLHIKEGEKTWERAVKNVIGRNLFAFLAKTDDAYRKAKSLYDKLWPRWKPPLTVYKLSNGIKQETIPLQKPLYKEIYEHAMNLVTGEPVVVNFLKRITKGLVAEDSYDPVILTKIAKDLRMNILTKSTKSYFLAQGGFGRPPMPIKTPFGWRVKTPTTNKQRFATDYYEEQKLRVTIAKLEKSLRELKISEIQTLRAISQLHKEIQSLGMPEEKLIGKIDSIADIVSLIKAKILESKMHKEKLVKNLQKLDEEFDSFATERLTLKRAIQQTQNELEKAKIERGVLEEKVTEVVMLELTLDSQYESLLEEQKEREANALVKGERPEEIRSYTEIRDELSRIEGNLESINISDVDEEKITAQKTKVESLKQYMVEREEHITNLRADLAARLTFWNGELQETITKITKAMKLLLSGIFEKIKLKITNINNPDEAGLFIEAITKGAGYRDFRELSGGEKVLAIEGLILAMHTLTDSPIHAIDEFTQRLDEKNKTLAFNIALRTQTLASENSRFVPQFILLCPDAINVDLSSNINHIVVSELKVIENEPIKNVQNTKKQ
ncbi:MAG: AAA family ATPase [Candidatus Heimdallarchaeota archaeon]|nr:AAA family ATPase [Candidatus Heimdallarchaeota archaeon]